jgi:galactosylceramidase
VYVPIGAFFTITTVFDGPAKGSHGPPPTSSPMFPMPYSDNFNSYPGQEDAVDSACLSPSSLPLAHCATSPHLHTRTESQEARYFSDQIGVFEIHTDSANDKLMRQMVPRLPIPSGDPGTSFAFRFLSRLSS